MGYGFNYDCFGRWLCSLIPYDYLAVWSEQLVQFQYYLLSFWIANLFIQDLEIFVEYILTFFVPAAEATIDFET